MAEPTNAASRACGFLSVPPPVRLARCALLTYWPCLMLGTHWPGFRIETRDTVFQAVALDKLMHAGAFFGLFALIAASRLDRWRSLHTPIVRQPWRAVGLALAIGLAYAVLDETSQAWFDREVSLGDIAANGAGVLIGCGLLLVVRVWTREKTQSEAPV